MSKRSKSHRFSDRPDFKELPQVSDDQVSGDSTAITVRSDSKGPGYRSGLLSPWNACRSAGVRLWTGLRAIPSYCVIRVDAEDEADESETPPAVQREANAPRSSANIDCDEDEEEEIASSPWWNIGIKSAAAASAVLILVAGYFALMPQLFKTPNDAAEAVAETAVEAPIETPIEVPEYRLNDTPVVIVPEPSTPELSAWDLPPQEPLFDDEPFFDPPVPVADASSAPAEPEPIQTLATLQPLSALDAVPDSVPDSAPASPLSLQPLVALDVSAEPPLEIAAALDAPVAEIASPNAAIARNFADPQTQRNRRNNATFSQAPIPPAVNTIPETTVQQTLPIIEPVREIIPQIPFSGTVEHLPPPEAPPPPDVAETESAPAIPKDAPAIPKDVQVESAPVPAQTHLAGTPRIPAPTEYRPNDSTEYRLNDSVESPPRMLSADSQPIDRQLRERLHAMRSESEPAPSNLRFESAAPAVSEPALRFTPKQAPPKQAPPPAFENENLLIESATALQGLLPSSSPAEDGASRLESAALEDHAPQPVWAVAQPAYRNEQEQSERGMTFQSRIDSQIKRSPVEAESYTVQQGDTYMTISEKFYGTSLLYTALAAHNQQLGIGWRPAEGVVIEIPTAQYLQAQYGKPEHRVETQRSVVRYIVQEGDTVFRLATNKLQDSTRWREIQAMNADRLQDVRDLKPGMEILLPVGRL